MSYSSSGAVALLSPANYSGTTKMPVPSSTRRYSSTSGATYRSTGNTDRSYLSSNTGSSYASASRSIQTEYRSRYSPSIRSSTSVPTSYSKISEIHETTSRIGNKDRSETNDNSLLTYSRSKTDNDVSATLERCGLKSDSFKQRSDPVSNRFLNTTKIDSRILNRKFGERTSLDFTRFNSSIRTSKVTDLNTRLQRKDSLTKSENADTSPSPIRKSSASVSSPIEIRRSTEVWNKWLSGSYENTKKGYFENDMFQNVDSENQADVEHRENSEDLSENTIILENIESEEKTLSFAEIRKKFDSNDVNDMKGGLESSSQKSSHSKDARTSISNGVILGVQNQYLDRNSKNKKEVDDSVEDSDVEASDIYQLDTNNSFPSSQTLHGVLLKRIPSNLKHNKNVSTNSSNNNNNSAYSNLKNSLDPIPIVSSNIKKGSLPDLKRVVPSPEKKEVNVSNVLRLTGAITSESRQLNEQKSDDETVKATNENKREARKTMVSNTLGVDSKNSIKIQPKKKGEKLLTKLEQTLSKPLDREPELLSSLSRVRRSPETKTKDFENETKVIALRIIEPFLTSPFEVNNKLKELEIKEKKALSPIHTGPKPTEKSPQKATKSNEKQIRTSPVKDIGKSVNIKEQEANISPLGVNREPLSTMKNKKNTSLKDEKETNNVRERELNKKLVNEEPAVLKLMQKPEEKIDVDIVAKEQSLLGKTEIAKNLNNRTFPGPSAYQNTNSYSSSENLENAGIRSTSPRLNVGWNRNTGLEKGGLNGLRNIGNTCFMNSVIQCLSNTKPLLEYLLNEDYLADINTTISGMKGALIKAFSNVIHELWAPNAEDKIINTINFKSQIQRFAPRFMGYSQQDAQEFLRYLLEGLHEDVNRVTVKPKPITTDIDDTLSDNQKASEAWKRYLRMDDSKVVDIFVGQLKSTLQCTVCSHCSVTFDPFWDLSLPVPNRNGQLRLSSCLDAFTKEEVLDGDEKPTCSKCKTRRKCTKSFSIQKFPKILVLHLKRFSPTERYRGKLSVTVEFPLLNLDLSPYAANKGQACTYNLYAISNHSGTAFSGHYTAYCKHPYTGNWHEYNDSGVSSLSSRSVVSGEAYVLFYELAAQTSHL